MHAGTRDPAIDIRSICWERVQLVIEARVEPSSTIAAAGLRLREVGGRRTLTPTRVDRDGDRLTIHYNVITGLDRDRLPDGRWTFGDRWRSRIQPLPASTRRWRAIVPPREWPVHGRARVRRGHPDARAGRIRR